MPAKVKNSVSSKHGRWVALVIALLATAVIGVFVFGDRSPGLYRSAVSVRSGGYSTAQQLATLAARLKSALEELPGEVVPNIKARLVNAPPSLRARWEQPSGLHLWINPNRADWKASFDPQDVSNVVLLAILDDAQSSGWVVFRGGDVSEMPEHLKSVDTSRLVRSDTEPGGGPQKPRLDAAGETQVISAFPNR